MYVDSQNISVLFDLYVRGAGSPVAEWIKRFPADPGSIFAGFVVVVDMLFYVLGKHLRSCRDGQLT